MKKVISVLVLTALVTAGAFAVDMSVGGGLFYDLSLLGGMKDDDGASMTFPNHSFGASVFFDATYVAVDLNFGIGFSLEGTQKDKDGKKADKADEYHGSQFVNFGFGLIGKYPIELDALTVFPLVGVTYNMVLSSSSPKYTADGKYDGREKDKYEGDEKISDLNQLGFVLGVGGDFDITEQLYFRGMLAAHLRLPNKEVKDFAKDFEVSAVPNIGPRLTLAVGYKL